MSSGDSDRVKTLNKKLNLGKLHVACSEGNPEDVRALLTQLESQLVDKRGRRRSSKDLLGTPDREDAYLLAHLPIHTACQRREGSRDVIRILLTDGGYSISSKTVNGDTSLHVACTSGNLEAVHALLSWSEPAVVRECLRHANKDGNTPLHLAAEQGNAEVTALVADRLLLPADCKPVLGRANKLGRTCVGIAIENEDWETAKQLLQRSHGNPAHLYQDFLEFLPECRPPEGVSAFEHEPVNAFLLGDAESGKTTVISTLRHTTLSTLSKLVSAIWSSPSPEEAFRACILPSILEYRRQDHRCAFVLHDVGGHRHYAQEALFACARDPLEALYVVTVDVRRDIEESVFYWLHFLRDQLVKHRHCVNTSVVQVYKMKVKVAIAFTYCDLVPASRLQFANKFDWSRVASSNESLAAEFTWCGNYQLNARKHNSLNMPQLVSKLHDQCHHHHHHSSGTSDGPGDSSRKMLAQTFLLASLLLKVYKEHAVTTLNDVIGLVQRTENGLCKMLPKEDEEIERLFHNLSILDRFKVMTFDLPNRRRRRWYVVLDYKHLLKSVESALSSLYHRSTNGMVTRQQIKSAFGNYRPDFIISFLEHLKLCEHVSNKGLECMRKSIRSSKRSLTSIGSNRSTADSAAMQDTSSRRARIRVTREGRNKTSPSHSTSAPSFSVSTPRLDAMEKDFPPSCSPDTDVTATMDTPTSRHRRARSDPPAMLDAAVPPTPDEQPSPLPPTPTRRFNSSPSPTPAPATPTIRRHQSTPVPPDLHKLSSGHSTSPCPLRSKALSLSSEEDHGLCISVEVIPSNDGDFSSRPPHSPAATPQDASRLRSVRARRSSKNSNSPMPGSRQSSRKSNTSHREDNYYFFPSLLPREQPQELWEEDSSEYTYGFAWSLVPHEDHRWFLSPKFATIVLFRLLFSFAPRPNPDSFVARQCKLWRGGIVWSDPLGARVCVAVHRDCCVTLSMQCLRGYEVQCLSIRNEIMADIKQQLGEMHPGIEPREIFIPYDGVTVFPVIDPTKSYSAFDKCEIWQAIAEKRPVICVEGKHHKSVDSLLHFEPLCYLPPSLLDCLFNTEYEHEQISDDFCMHLAKNLSTSWQHLAKHFLDTVIHKYYIDGLRDDGAAKGPPYDTAMKMLVYLREVEYKNESARVDTYAGLRRSLFEISIFTPDEVTEYDDIVT